MNLFGFNYSDAVQGLFLAFGYGLSIGVVFAVARFLIFTVLERKE